LPTELIRKHELEALLKNLASIKATAETLRLQAQTFTEESEAEFIEGTNFKRKLDGMPQATKNIVDKTSKLAVKLNKTDTTTEVLKEIYTDLLLLETVIQKLNIALNALRQDELKVIELRYFEGLAWIGIADEFLVSKATAQRLRSEALNKMRVVARIAIDDYNKIMKILNLN